MVSHMRTLVNIENITPKIKIKIIKFLLQAPIVRLEHYSPQGVAFLKEKRRMENNSLILKTLGNLILETNTPQLNWENLLSNKQFFYNIDEKSIFFQTWNTINEEIISSIHILNMPK